MKTLKSTLTLLLIVTTSCLFSQAHIPNQDFESWTNSISPKNWQTTTDLLPPGYITSQRISDSHSGSYAIELTTIDLDGWAVPGVITLGTIGIGYTEGGISFVDKPVSLKGFLRHPSSGDQVMVAVQFYREGEEIGGGFWSTIDSIPVYQEFTVPISFAGPAAPDTMNITILTDQDKPGSSMAIDGLHFEYLATGTDHENGMNDLKIRPNPCTNQLIMETPPGQGFEASILDLNGRVVLRSSKREAKVLDTSSLPSGTYVLLVQTSTEAYRQKIIRQ